MKVLILNREIRISWLGLLVYFLLLALLCSLGVWQLNRAEQKKQILAQQEQALAQNDTLDLNQQAAIDLSEKRYHKVSAAGHYDTRHQFLIDNQMLDGKPGFLVLTPFHIDGKQRAVLVNRGWLPLGKDRGSLPDVEIKAAVDKISGRINLFPAVGIKLKGAEIPTDHWPAILQVVDSEVLAAKLAYPLYDFQIELASEADAGYARQWKKNVAITPEKHLAYAVQWFSLALALTVLFIWISIRK